jgi:hypothetical protein
MASSVCTCGNSSASLCGYGLVKSPAIRRVRTGDGGNAQLPWQRLPKNCTETKRMTAPARAGAAGSVFLLNYQRQAGPKPMPTGPIPMPKLTPGA